MRRPELEAAAGPSAGSGTDGGTLKRTTGHDEPTPAPVRVQTFEQVAKPAARVIARCAAEAREGARP